MERGREREEEESLGLRMRREEAKCAKRWDAFGGDVFSGVQFREGLSHVQAYVGNLAIHN